MFLSEIAALLPTERKPESKWFFWDNHITGVTASKDYERNHIGVILPHGLSDEERDLVLWAWEAGFAQGQHESAQDAKRKIRNAIGCGT